MKNETLQRRWEHPSDCVTIAYMCDAYRQSIYSSTDNYSLSNIMRDVLRITKDCLFDDMLYEDTQ